MANLYSIRKTIKIPSSRIITKPKKAKGEPKWQLNITLDDLQQKNQLVGLASSYVTRSLDDIVGTGYDEERVRELKHEMKLINSKKFLKKNINEYEQKKNELFDMLYLPYIVCVHIDKQKHYDNLLDGFKIVVIDTDRNNKVLSNINYKYFLSTSASIKKWDIFFVDERYVDELQRRIDNDRNPDVEFVPAKLAAYRALTMSSTNPVTDTNRVLVVDDLEVTFKTEVLELDGSQQEEPIMRHVKDYDMNLNCTDGYGFISREFASTWAEDLHLDFVPAGFVTRNAFCKGVLIPFDYKQYAEEIQMYYVEDAWGNVHDIRDIDIVLTTSMLKLKKCYDSYAHYYECCQKNKHSFSVVKWTPKVIDMERTTNYQFIQAMELTEQEIKEFIKPTLNTIKGIKGADYRQTLAYLRGMSLTEDTDVVRADFSTALMIEPKLIADSSITSQIHNLIEKSIRDVKKGTIKVRGNYQTITIDPIMLCQHIFKQPIQGFLKENEIFNRFWIDLNVKEVVALRAPMVSYNNVKIVDVVTSDEMEKWYGHLNGLVILNGCDTLCARLSGADLDGDTFFTTDNEYMLKGYRRPSLPVVCLQNAVDKEYCTLEKFQNSDRMLINSKAENVGVITNRATAIQAVQAKFPVGSKEWLELEYRIQACIMKSQDSIDAAKGIEIPYGFPRTWIDRNACNEIQDEEKREFYKSIVADKKPLFMVEVYETEKRKRRSLRQKENMRCLTSYGRTLDEVLKKPLTEEEERTKRLYYSQTPVDENEQCVMNIIYNNVDEQMKDFTISKKGVNLSDLYKTEKGYPYRFIQKHKKELDSLYKAYVQMSDSLLDYKNIQKRSSRERAEFEAMKKEELRQQAHLIHNNSEILCNIMVDYVYENKDVSKLFLWWICGEQLIENLLKSHNYKLKYPIVYSGDDFDLNDKKYFIYKERKMMMYEKPITKGEDFYEENSE